MAFIYAHVSISIQSLQEHEQPMQWIKIQLLLTGIVFLGGCSHFQPPPTLRYIPWPERQIKLQQNKDWIINGSLSITHNKKRDLAHFEWQQKQDKYTINIAGPMNLHRMKITGTSQHVELCQSNNKCNQARSPEQLLFKQFGWQLPISNLRYWVSALPAPTRIDAVRFDQYGRLVALKQQDWKIYYSGFHPTQGIDLPDMIELQHQQFTLKLKIKNRSEFYE